MALRYRHVQQRLAYGYVTPVNLTKSGKQHANSQHSDPLNLTADEMPKVRDVAGHKVIAFCAYRGRENRQVFVGKPMPLGDDSGGTRDFHLARKVNETRQGF